MEYNHGRSSRDDQVIKQSEIGPMIHENTERKFGKLFRKKAIN